MHRRVRHLNPAQCGAQIALDARFITGVSDGAALSSWSSRSVASIGATQSTPAQQPTFRAASINGRPAVEFDGTADNMNLDAAARSLTNNVGNLSAICVAVCDGTATDTTQTMVHFSVGTGGLSRAALQFLTGSNGARMQGRRLDADTAATTGVASGGMGVGVYGMRVDWSNNTTTANRNGVSTTSATFSSGAGNTSATNSVSAVVGAVSSASARLQGRIAAVAVAVPWFSLPMAKRIREHFGFSFRIATH